jgi:hypothetical protein
MLIRNVRSFRDLENQKKMQAELLQLQIDNEALLEKRVGDYQNPNKPPPVPPQYKTQSEVESDNLAQQKQAIDNLRLLGADYSVAAQVSQELLQLPDGDGALVKLNKFFPQIQKFFDDTISSKSRNSSVVLMEKLKQYFSRIDTAVGINIRDTNATNYFARTPLAAKDSIATKEDYEDIGRILLGIFDIYTNASGEEFSASNYNMEEVVKPILNATNNLFNFSPPASSLDAIELLPITERQAELTNLEQLITIYKIPTGKVIKQIKNDFNSGVKDPNKNLAEYKNILNSVKDKSYQELAKFTQKLETEQSGQVAVIAQDPEEIAIKKAIDLALAKLTTTGISQQDIDNFKEQAYQYAITGRASNNQTTKNLRGKNEITKLINQEMLRLNPPPPPPAAVVVAPPPPPAVRPQPAGGAQAGPQPAIARLPDLTTIENDFRNSIFNNRKNARPLAAEINQNNLNKITPYNTFLPTNLQINQNSTVKDAKSALAELKKLKTQGRGLTDKVLKHFREDNNDLLKLKKGFNRHLQVEKIADGYSSSSDSSMEGKGMKKAFKAHRIKLGKGISIPEIPKYREFGKFIVHYPQLIDSNILNLKFPSTGTIPHIKPVYVDENFKEFIIDTLNTGRVNNRHFDSLTEPEKSHFTKIARGAKLTEKLNLKPLTEDREKDDLNRLQLMLGEINAGNDNEKLLKETRALVKKYIANGRINKNKGLEILLELE